MSSGGDDARDDPPEAGGGSEQEVGMEQETAPQAVQASSTPGDQSPLHIDDDDPNMPVDEHSEFMQNFDVDSILQSLDETHGLASDQRSTVTHPQHQADKSPTEEPDSKHPRMESDEAETTAYTQVSNLPYPLVDAMIFKDAIPGLQIDLADRQNHMVRTIGPRYKLCGAVAHFQHVSSFVDNNLVDERQGSAATIAACVDADDWYPVSDIAGAVIGCDPQEVHLLNESVWTYIQGLIVSAQVGPYPLVGLYSGIDVTGLSRNQFATDKEFHDAEILLAQDQGTAFARFAALAARHHLPLTIYCNDAEGHPCSSIDVALHLLKQVPDFSRTHRICVSQFLYFPQQAEKFLKEFPNTVFGITEDFTRHVDRDTAEWIKAVPWQALVFQSMAPLLRGFADEDGDCNDSSDCIRRIASQLARISGDNAAVIIQKMTEAAIAHYGLLAANRQLLEGTRPNGTLSDIDKPTWGEYHSGLQSRAGGPPQPHPTTEDVIKGVQMPATPWNLPHQAVIRPEPARAIQPGPLPSFDEFVVEQAEPAQQEMFRTTDLTQTWFEYLRRCPDHGQKKGTRYHPNIRSIIESWPKFERDPKITAQQRNFRVRLGDRTVNSFGKVHLTFAASRFMRHHPNRVVEFLDAITATWDRQALEAHVNNFYREIRGNELLRSNTEIEAGTRKPEDAINTAAIGFGPSEALLALRLWSLRCEPARQYYVDHPRTGVLLHGVPQLRVCGRWSPPEL
ncbi:hypothetical protein AAVH_21513 [Aphelenchoides avenae]|nr:hypothetical protein AAVH_21513 [Aphelenchus avenae]